MSITLYKSPATGTYIAYRIFCSAKTLGNKGSWKKSTIQKKGGRRKGKSLWLGVAITHVATTNYQIYERVPPLVSCTPKISSFSLFFLFVFLLFLLLFCFLKESSVRTYVSEKGRGEGWTGSEHCCSLASLASG